MIYFAYSHKIEQIKIGTSRHIRVRLSTLGKEFGRLKLLGYMEGDRVEEKQLHQRFKEFNSGLKKEWFFDVPQIREYIAQNTSMTIPPWSKTMVTLNRLSASRLEYMAYVMNKPMSETLDDLILGAMPNIDTYMEELETLRLKFRKDNETFLIKNEISD